MVLLGSIRNGVVVLDVPEGTPVTVEVIEASTEPPQRRQGGQWKGQVHIADDFDELPDDIAEAFGANHQM